MKGNVYTSMYVHGRECVCVCVCLPAPHFKNIVVSTSSRKFVFLNDIFMFRCVDAMAAAAAAVSDCCRSKDTSFTHK